MTCSFPGCSAQGMVIPVGPDIATFRDPETLEQALADGRPSYVTSIACSAHIAIVKRRLQEQHQPRRMAMREGRP